MKRIPLRWASAYLTVGLICPAAVGQELYPVLPSPSGSLYGKAQAAMTLENTSMYYQAVPPPKILQLHDFVTVIVNDLAEVISEGEIQRRKNALYDARLSDWTLLKGLSLVPDPQTAGDPRVAGQLNSQVRATSELETGDAIRFTIQCRIVDVRPNGNLVIEGHSKYKINEDVWERELTGIINPEDVTPAGTVLSTKVAELQINKHEVGYVRDGYRRGWFGRFFDAIQPF